MATPSDPEPHRTNLPTDDGVSSELPTTNGSSLHERKLVANRHEILSRLGKGGMGEVWHAYDLKLRVDVALKSLRMDLRGNKDRVEAPRREVRTAREVISPNVCRIFDLVVEDQQELISMEYIDGTTLMELLVQKGPMELRQARDVAAQFLAGLEASHQAGLVHRKSFAKAHWRNGSTSFGELHYNLSRRASSSSGNLRQVKIVADRDE